jgi:Tol biopolymer transport system component
MKKNLNTKGTLEILLVIGVIMIIPLFFVMRTAAEQNAAPNTLPPTVVIAPLLPTVANAPEDNNAMKPKQPPACTFPLAGTTTEESTPEEYTFSEPQVVITPEANDSHAEIVDWLPDSQRVLLIQNFSDTIKQNIELFDPQTGSIQLYATRNQNFDLSAAWVSGLNAVVYPSMNIIKDDKVNHRVEFTRQMWVSQGDPNNAQLIADNLEESYIAVKPDGSQMAYQHNKQLFKRDSSLAALKSVAFDPTKWDHRQSSNSSLSPFKTAWRPGTSQIFFYSHSMGSIGYTFLLDADTGQLCELNFDGWALFGRWSPNGRYLAIVRNQEASFPVNSTDLAVLDTDTGDLYTMGVTPKETEGRYYVNDIAWAPDNHHLLTLGSVQSFPGCSPDCHKDTQLYLVDFLSGQVNALIPARQYIANNSGTNLAWSPDGYKVLAFCPKLCLISVKRNGQ